MLDVVDITEPFSVVDFRKQVEELDIWKRMIDNHAFPILCGGTGLYIDSLIYERDYMGQKPDFTRRYELEAYRAKHGNQALWNLLHGIDPVYADILHVNNYTYIIRGIEVFEKTGASKLEAQH